MITTIVLGVIALAVLIGAVYVIRTAMQLQNKAMETGINYAMRYNQQLVEQSEAERKHEKLMVGDLGKPPEVTDIDEEDEKIKFFDDSNIPTAGPGGIQ